MRSLNVKQIEEKAYEMIVTACTHITASGINALTKAYRNEKSDRAKFCLKTLLDNAEVAKEEKMPVCQDTGMAVFNLELGQDLHIEGGFIEDAINSAVKRAYTENFFRKSVCDPLTRVNTENNTPAVINYRITKGDKLKMTFLPKGFGSENMSRIFMLKPAEGIAGIKNAVISAVKDADSRPCPPVYIGVGIGGTFDKCASLAKKAIMRPVGERNPREDVAELEINLLTEINKLNIGAQGLGGNNTAIGVSVEIAPTHIAGLPVAVNFQCNCIREEVAEL